MNSNVLIEFTKQTRIENAPISLPNNRNSERSSIFTKRNTNSNVPMNLQNEYQKYSIKINAAYKVEHNFQNHNYAHKRGDLL